VLYFPKYKVWKGFKQLNSPSRSLKVTDNSIIIVIIIIIIIIIVIIIIIMIMIMIIIMIIINDNVYGAVLMAMVTARVHPVHLMNAD